ncbi:MAG: tRNA preQ1(34) S-adenosylmethionine ribosyltransferase-isomerase QueA [Deltaproteobacteria bacterium]|nr:tRNA preQ1(34) S-adenosylmethionine ribosyltransferase-isomerase QueA [Deltaproteobacteria bacterium]
MKVSELDYELPRELIASEPPQERDGARLLVVDRAGDSLEHRMIRSLPSVIPQGSLMVVNDTRVIPARIRGRKHTGGAVEIFLLKALDAHAKRWSAFGKSSKKISAGLEVLVGEGFTIHVVDKSPEGVLEVELVCDDPWAAIERHGEVPLPPYMERAPNEEDKERYQCVFAANPGAVAAPTAGLHLSTRMLEDFAARDIERVAVTLHVGAGTFLPVSVEDLDTHPMHSEHYLIADAVAEKLLQAKREGRPVFAVGTTVVRTLESWALDQGARSGETRLLIQPGYSLRVIDMLLTNFHLPRSTLLALVMALAGEERTRRAYALAVEARYKFFSYGDAMLVR